MAFDLGSLLGSLVNTGGNIYGTVLEKQLVDQLMSGKSTVLGNLNTLAGNAQGSVSSLMQQLLPTMAGVQNASQNNFFNDQSGLGGYLNQGLMGLGGFQSMLDPNSIPGLSSYFGQLGGEQGYGQNLAGTALSLANGSALQPMLGVGNSLLGGTANSAFQQMLQNAAGQSIGAGGYTSPLNTVANFGTSLLNPNGLATQAGNLAGSIFGNGQPVLPMQQAVSLAINQNATQSQQQEDQLRRQLLDRTGVTGPMIASGQQNELLENLGNQALQNQSSAVNQAIQGQEGLGLQQLAQGNNLFSGATGANLGYYGQGLNALLQSQGQAGQLMNILGNLGLGGGSLGLNTIATGGNLLTGYNSGALGGLNSANGILSELQNINQGGAGTELNAQNLGLQQKQGQYGALSSLLGQGNTQAQQALSSMFQSAGIPASLLGEFMQQLTGSTTAQTGLYGGTPQYPSQFMQNLMGGSGGSLFGQNGLGSLLNSLGLGNGSGSGSGLPQLGTGVNAPIYGPWDPNGAMGNGGGFPGGGGGGWGGGWPVDLGGDWWNS